MRRPNLFIVGAPKCGTTSLCSYLAQHPQIFMPERLEYYYLCSDLPLIDWTQSDYLAYFQGASEDQPVIGEGSTWYLYSKTAAANIKAFSPEAKIIALVRNPVTMLPSLHAQLLSTAFEDIADFEQAYAAQTDRQQGNRLPRPLLGPQALLYYSDWARYSAQIQRYLDIFGRERVRVIIFDDLVTQTPVVYRDTLNFLGVEDSFQAHFEIKNASKRVRSRRIMQFIFRPPAGLRRAANRYLSPQLRHRIFSEVYRRNIKAEAWAPIGPELRKRIAEEFENEIQCLSRLLDRDLTGWLDVE